MSSRKFCRLCAQPAVKGSGLCPDHIHTEDCYCNTCLNKRSAEARERRAAVHKMVTVHKTDFNGRLKVTLPRAPWEDNYVGPRQNHRRSRPTTAGE